MPGLDTINRLHLTNGTWVDVLPGTFTIGNDPIFPGRPVAVFTSPPPMMGGRSSGPMTECAVPLGMIAMVVRNHPEES